MSPRAVLARGDSRATDSAEALLTKHKEAVTQAAAAAQVVAEIERKFDVRTVDAWKVQETDWLGKVVDIKHHRELDNPYEVRKDAGARVFGPGSCTEY